MKNTIKITCVILAALIGAGFASGKEIYSFFFIYGKHGIISMCISALIISLVIYKVMSFCDCNKIENYKTFCSYIAKGNKALSNLLNNVTVIFMLISFFVMITGFSALLKQELQLNKFVGCAIILIFNYVVSLKNIEGLAKLSNVIIPFFIFFLLKVSLKENNFAFVTSVDNWRICNNIFECIYCYIKSVLYATYNCTQLIPVVIMLNSSYKNTFQKKYFSGCNCSYNKSNYNNTCIMSNTFAKSNKHPKIHNAINNTNNIKKLKSKCYINKNNSVSKIFNKTLKNFLVSIAVFVTILALSLAVYNILLGGNAESYLLEMPLIFIIQKYGKIYKILYIFLIAISIFTTATSSAVSFVNNVCSNKKNTLKVLLLMSLVAIPLSQVSFGNLVNLLYPALGIFGFVEILLIIVVTN